jgi:drug/metabolite transporter (DMT)-like permease
MGPIRPTARAWPLAEFLPTADPAGANLAVVVLGLSAAAAFGAGDFGGGWTSRRAPVLGVSLVVEVIGLTTMTAAALLAREPPPGPGPAALAAVGGLFGLIGLVSLYHGLSVGRMGVVAPVTGVLAAIVPVVVGVVLEGALPPLVWLGIGSAIVAVVLVSSAAGAEGGRSGLEFAVAAGLGIGLSQVFLGLIPEGSLFWALAIVKLSAGGLLVAVILLARQAWRVPRRVVPAAIGVALLDSAGNGFFLLAAQAGALAIAAVLSSLYPVTTVILAVALLHERLTRVHVVGIAAAGVAIVLIGAGSAG